MKEKERFQFLRMQKSRLSMNGRFMLVSSMTVSLSLMAAFGLAYLLKWMIPSIDRIPLLIQLLILSDAIALLTARLCSRIFLVPITALREGMRKVADGDFNVRLETKSSSREIQEVSAGFNMMVQELQSTEIMQTDFVSNVSHEFKTPINAIEGYTMLLQGSDNLDEEENGYIEKILFNTRRLSSLVSNILLLSKIENQSILTNRRQYGLSEQVREAILALEPAWESKDIDFDVDLGALDYYGNENLLYHVWTNLIGNAIKFSPQGGLVKIRLERRDGKLIFYVEDCGPGISEDGTAHIFDKFYQEDTSHRGEGNGLGLPLVKRILNISDGEIGVENLPTGGCRFTVTLNEKI